MTDTQRYKYGPMTIEMKGVGDLQNKLFAMQEEGKLVPVIRDALSAGGGELKKSMAAQAPVDTGWLESHFRVTNPFIKLKQNIASVWVGPSKRKYTRPSQYLKNGKLRKGIGGKALKKGQTDDSAKSPAMIAREIEYGLHNMHHTNPFMHRAINAAREAALVRMMAKLKELVDKWKMGR